MIEMSEKNTNFSQNSEKNKKFFNYFQVFAGLNPSGELDDETVELMNTPRCGVKDNVGPSDNAKRKKRYALQGSRWTKDTLDWRIRQDDHNQSQRQNEEKVPLLILKENLVLEEVIVQKTLDFCKITSTAKINVFL